MNRDTDNIMTEEWLHSRWEKDSRYYELLVQQDLLGPVAADAGLGSAWFGYGADTP
jgi:hypothetical protein